MILTWKWKVYLALACALIIFGLGCGLGWKLWGQKPKLTTESLASAYRLPDDNLVLGRSPSLHPTLPIPPADLPAGSTVQRVVKVVVQGQPEASPAPAATQAQPAGQIPSLPNPCPPVEVDLTLVKLRDQSYRVIASSPNGVIQDTSVDIPVAPDVPLPADEHPNEVLIRYDPFNHVGGLGYLRHWHRVVVGADLNMVRQSLAVGAPTTAAAFVVVGFSF